MVHAGARANDGTASLKVVEQLGNLRARQASAIAHPAVPATKLPRPCSMLRASRGPAFDDRARKLMRFGVETSGDARSRRARPSGEAKAVQKMKLHTGAPKHWPGPTTIPNSSVRRSTGWRPSSSSTRASPAGAKFDPAALDDGAASLVAKTRDDPDFWSVVGLTELRDLRGDRRVGSWQARLDVHLSARLDDLARA